MPHSGRSRSPAARLAGCHSDARPCICVQPRGVRELRERIDYGHQYLSLLVTSMEGHPPSALNDASRSLALRPLAASRRQNVDRNTPCQC